MMSGSRPLCLLFSLLLLCSFSPLLYYSLLHQKDYVHEHHPTVPQRNMLILLWNWPFGRSYSLDGDTCLDMYNISRCHLTDDADSFSEADVVVFHHQELSRGLSTLPLHLRRPSSQRWVWLSLEPPINNLDLSKFNGLFNWTMSYRRDADIPIPYGETVPGARELGFRSARNRSCFAGWVVSRYRPGQTRTGVYQSLKNYVPIDVYGKWNRKPLPDQELLPTIGNCLFYLSFENSEAKDYISEKLWRNAFQAGAVPVVLGPDRATYEAVAPPHSFIHVADFRSTEELADYLKHVAADHQAYEEYFQWHRTHRIKTYTDWRERLCQICVKHPDLHISKVYQDLEGWVNS